MHIQITTITTMQCSALSVSRLGVGLQQRPGRTSTAQGDKSLRSFAPARPSQFTQLSLKLNRSQQRCRPAAVSASLVPSVPALPEVQGPSRAPISAVADVKKQSWLPRLRLGAGVALCLVLFAVTSGAAHAATTDASKGWLAYLVRSGVLPASLRQTMRKSMLTVSSLTTTRSGTDNIN